MTLDKNKVLLGFSGGVDSTCTALILRKKGYVVQGLFLNVSGVENESLNRAINVAQKLDMPLKTVDVSKPFKKKVKDYLYREYIQGNTPNPCVECNKYIKFNILMSEAKKIGAHYIATGHYAVNEYNEKIQEYVIKRPKALYKDQTYMLYNLNQHLLHHVLFPLGNIESKEIVREIVKKHNLPNAKTKDSQEICFIDDNDYINYIKSHYDYKNVPGDFIDEKGNVLGKHQGIINHTIGQRKGLGIALGKPVYVTKIDARQNTITLGKDADLFKDVVYSKNNNFINKKNTLPQVVEAKIRYSAKPSNATISKEKDGLKTVFKDPQRAITAGQSIVFYSKDILLGGGIIV